MTELLKSATCIVDTLEYRQIMYYLSITNNPAIRAALEEARPRSREAYTLDTEDAAITGPLDEEEVARAVAAWEEQKRREQENGGT